MYKDRDASKVKRTDKNQWIVYNGMISIVADNFQYYGQNIMSILMKISIKDFGKINQSDIKSSYLLKREQKRLFRIKIHSLVDYKCL